MLMVASQRSVPPNWAVTAGPKSHSPAPTDEPASRIPGPSSAVNLRQEKTGGDSRVPTSQAGNCPAGIRSPGTIGSTDSRLPATAACGLATGVDGDSSGNECV